MAPGASVAFTWGGRVMLVTVLPGALTVFTNVATCVWPEVPGD